MKNYTFLTRQEYFETLVREANRAEPGTRIIVASMAFYPDEPLISAIAAALARAAKRGAHATLIIDAINFMVGPHWQIGPLLYRNSFADSGGVFGRVNDALQHVAASGGTVKVINRPARRFQPYMFGRSHIKGAVIGDRVFVGGCNLERPAQIDLMVSWEDALSAHTVTNWFERIADTENVRTAFGDVDIVTRLDDTRKLLLDAGVPGQSVIYEEALRLIDEAREGLLITCQYFPGGPTAKHLAAAQTRGVHVEIIYGHPRMQRLQAPLHYMHQLQQRTRGLPPNFFRGRLDRQAPKLHAKILLSERAALVGSHNFVPQGVQFGTAELALRSTDHAFIHELRTFIYAQLATARGTRASPAKTRKALTK